MDIGLDLGTTNIVLAVRGKGVVLSEPSILAYHKQKDEMIAIGQKAYDMLGKTPDYIELIRPMKNGVISDDMHTQYLIREMILRISGQLLLKPRIVICVPSLITDVERRAVMKTAHMAGARRVSLIQEPLAAMLGAGVEIRNAQGNMVVDIGGGTTDVAVVSMNGVVLANSFKVAGDMLNQEIQQYMLNQYKLKIGERTAEEVKIELLNLKNPSEDVCKMISGIHIVKGLPKQISLSEAELYNALENVIYKLLESVRSVLRETPPELIADIYDNGILLTGGGANIRGISYLFQRVLGVNAHVAKESMYCVAHGTIKAFHRHDSLLDGYENVDLRTEE